MQQLLHTPEGVRDFYSDECAARLALCGRIQSTFQLYGYQSIQTPAFEYFDIFNAERGSVSSKEMYKFFDRDGETLVLRPDFTPSIARCAAKYYMNEVLPVRLCYQGNTYINNVSYQGRLKEGMQAGAELIGDDSVAADAEIIAMVVDSLKASGLTEFQVEVGQVDFFNGLLEESHLCAEQVQELRLLIEHKNHFGLEGKIRSLDLPSGVVDALCSLPQLFGSAEQVFSEARRLTDNPTALKAVARLEELYDLLKAYQMEKYISFDLGMLGNFRYYTGIIFKAYTYGTGDSVVTGGRYDNLMVQFGKEAPSIGFGLSVDTLMSALMRQKIVIPFTTGGTLLLYDPQMRERAIGLASSYRAEGNRVHLLETQLVDVECYVNYAKEQHLDQVLYLPAMDNGIRTVWKNNEEEVE